MVIIRTESGMGQGESLLLMSSSIRDKEASNNSLCLHSELTNRDAATLTSSSERTEEGKANMVDMQELGMEQEDANTLRAP